MLTPDFSLVVVALLVWLVCGFVAFYAGPLRYSGRLFWLTFLFMGPMGIAAALIMQTIEDFAPEQPQPPARPQTPAPRKARQSSGAKITSKRSPVPPAARRDELKEADAAAAKAEAELEAAHARLEEVRRQIGRTDTSP